MTKNLNVWCTLFHESECKIYIQDEDGETLSEYLHVQGDPISVKEVYKKTGEIKGSYKGICESVKEIKEREKEFMKRNKEDFARYYGRREADKYFK
nr:MAG TPA: hypothetical protein [Caudoviricetes sp.]